MKWRRFVNRHRLGALMLLVSIGARAYVYWLSDTAEGAIGADRRSGGWARLWHRERRLRRDFEVSGFGGDAIAERVRAVSGIRFAMSDGDFGPPAFAAREGQTALDGFADSVYGGTLELREAGAK